MSNDYNKIIASWRRYMDVEKLCNLKISANKITDGQIIDLERDLIKENDNAIGIKINEKFFHYLMNSRTESRNTKIIIGITPIELMFNREISYIPLFIFSMEKTYEELLSLPVELATKNELFPMIEIDFHSASNYYTSTMALKEYFGIEPEDIPVNLPLATLMKDLSESKEVWFENIKNDFVRWANSSIIGNKKYR